MGERGGGGGGRGGKWLGTDGLAVRELHIWEGGALGTQVDS